MRLEFKHFTTKKQKSTKHKVDLVQEMRDQKKKSHNTSRKQVPK